MHCCSPASSQWDKFLSDQGNGSCKYDTKIVSHQPLTGKSMNKVNENLLKKHLEEEIDVES